MRLHRESPRSMSGRDGNPLPNSPQGRRPTNPAPLSTDRHHLQATIEETSNHTSHSVAPLETPPNRLSHAAPNDTHTPSACPSSRLGRSSVRLRRHASNGTTRMAEVSNTPPRQGSRQGEGNTFNAQDSSHLQAISEPERALLPGRAIGGQRARDGPTMLRLTEEGNRPSAADLADGRGAGEEPFPSFEFEQGGDCTYGRQNDEQMPAERRDRRLFRRPSSILRWRGDRQAREDATVNLAGWHGKPDNEYDKELVDLLDVVDPEVSTLSTLNNIQNSLFVPNLGSWVNRWPTYVLSDDQPRPGDDQHEYIKSPQQPLGDEPAPGADDVESKEEESRLSRPPLENAQRDLQRTETHFSITSRFSESRFAVLPHGAHLNECSSQEKAELNDYVRHMLHSRRSRLKRSLQGFGQYVRRPLGFLVTLYATLITLFGLAWVLFLIGWIYVGEKQLYVIHVIDSVLVALFAIMGDGLAPFRAADTYHMIFVAYYSHKTWRLRKEKQLPKLKNKNDLPTRRFWISKPIPLAPGDDPNDHVQDLVHDLEAAKDMEPEPELSVLSAKEQHRLQHHQKKLNRSHTFYKPHETETHHAFSIRYLIAIVCLLDAHSCLQISLGACTWGIDYRVRPFALTTVILCLSITCNVTAGVLISVGDRMARKKDVSRLLKRRELTVMAIEHLERTRQKEGRKPEDKGQRWHQEDNKAQSMPKQVHKRSKEADNGDKDAISGIPGPERINLTKANEKRTRREERPKSGRNKLQKGDTWSNRRRARQKMG